MLIDMYNDLMGYAVRKLPMKYINPGHEQTLLIHGETAGSQAWYMTFGSPVHEQVEVAQVPAVVGRKGRSYVLKLSGHQRHM